MKTFLSIFLTFLLISCSLTGGGRSFSKLENGDLKHKLENKKSWYEKLYKPDLHDCDSLLFTSLALQFPLDSFKDEKGKFYRTPSKDCYPDRSKSSISRDMLLGVMWNAWLKKDLPLAQGLYNFAVKNSWVMGEGELSRTLFTPELMGTLSLLVDRLGGESSSFLQLIPYVNQSTPTGYQAHLQVLHTLLRKELGDDSEVLDQVIRNQVKRQPQNPLFVYADGQVEKAGSLLLDPTYWPDLRLPNSSDRCEGWLFQRDFSETKDWKPCKSQNKIHTGGDFLFLANLILRD